MKEQFLQLLREVLDEDDKEISLDDKFRDYDEWDSLTNLTLIAMLDDEYGIVIPNEEFNELTTVGQLLEEVVKRKA